MNANNLKDNFIPNQERLNNNLGNLRKEEVKIKIFKFSTFKIMIKFQITLAILNLKMKLILFIPTEH